ncbi:hypothetical protein EUTSA_v10012298mg, partial [Eutrema salsugineum]
FFSYGTISAVTFNFNHFDGTNLIFIGYAELGPATDGMSRSGALSPVTTFHSHMVKAFTHIPFHSNPPTTLLLLLFILTKHLSLSPSLLTGQALTPNLGLVNRTTNGSPNNHLFAVEFDVFQDKRFGDINDNHVGIDINSVHSMVSKRAGYWAWIEYKNNKVTITLAPAHLKKPKRPLIETQVDLSKVFLETMYTGFPGSMGRGIERHDIWSWSFENTAKNS